MNCRRWLAFVVVSVLTVGCAQSDPGITTAVKAKLAADDVVKSYRIDVDTNNRVVTLSGAVDTAQARERAMQIAKNTNGVASVVDELVVSPGVTPTTGIDDALRGSADEAKRKSGEALGNAAGALSDAAVTTAVKTKFLADRDISGFGIDVDTSNGVVTLTGSVPSSAEKQRALTVAKETDGVKSVVDRLKVAK